MSKEDFSVSVESKKEVYSRPVFIDGGSEALERSFGILYDVVNLTKLESVGTTEIMESDFAESMLSLKSINKMIENYEEMLRVLRLGVEESFPEVFTIPPTATEDTERTPWADAFRGWRKKGDTTSSIELKEEQWRCVVLKNTRSENETIRNKALSHKLTRPKTIYAPGQEEFAEHIEALLALVKYIKEQVYSQVETMGALYRYNYRPVEQVKSILEEFKNVLPSKEWNHTKYYLTRAGMDESLRKLLFGNDGKTQVLAKVFTEGYWGEEFVQVESLKTVLDIILGPKNYLIKHSELLVTGFEGGKIVDNKQVGGEPIYSARVVFMTTLGDLGYGVVTRTSPFNDPKNGQKAIISLATRQAISAAYPVFIPEKFKGKGPKKVAKSLRGEVIQAAKGMYTDKQKKVGEQVFRIEERTGNSLRIEIVDKLYEGFGNGYLYLENVEKAPKRVDLIEPKQLKPAYKDTEKSGN